MAKFYTRTGDNGTSGLLGEGRVPKHHPRLEAVGSIDEANAALGLARAHCSLPLIRETLLNIQRDLYHLMAEVAATPDNAAHFRQVDAEWVTCLERQIHHFSEDLPPLKDFIIPGDSLAGAALDVARTLVRRAERRVAFLHHTGELENLELLRYLNRLSSLCFVLELVENNQTIDTRNTHKKDA